jgi:hypothetical protein
MYIEVISTATYTPHKPQEENEKLDYCPYTPLAVQILKYMCTLVSKKTRTTTLNVTNDDSAYILSHYMLMNAKRGPNNVKKTRKKTDDKPPRI